MFGFMTPLLDGFGFDDSQQLIAAVCLVVFLGNFIGGLLSSMLVAHAGPQRPRKAHEKIGFRLALVSELFLAIFAVYYHGWLVFDVSIPQIVYWAAALLISPLLAYIGAQITYVVFQKRIEANEAAYMKWLAQQRRKQAKGGGKARAAKA